jgi:hypothetical protein
MGVVAVDFGLSESDGGFVAGGSPDQWEWGVAVDGPAGTVGWSTRLNGPYLHDAESTLTLGAVDLSGLTDPHLVLTVWTAVAAGDGVVVETNDGSGWTVATPIYGYPTADGWSGVADFAEYAFALAGLGPSPGLRLVLRTNGAGTDDGLTLSAASIVDGDAAAPRVALVSGPADPTDLYDEARVVVDVLDDRTVTEVVVRSDVGVVAAVEETPGRWEAVLPAATVPGEMRSWHVEASDGGNVGRLPPSGDLTFRWFLPAPTGVGVSASGARHVALALDVVFDAPPSLVPPSAYRVRLDGVELGDVAGSPGAVSLTASGASLDVAGVWPEGVGDFSVPVAVDVSVPSLTLVPAAVAPGARPWVDVSGAFLGLVDGSSLDFGEGVSVTTLEVIDVDTARVGLDVAADAAVGPRDVAVDGAWGGFVFARAFTVDDALAAPRVVDVVPGEVPQGATVTVRVTSSAPFARVPVVTADDALVVGNVAVDGSVATLDVTANGGAALGPHTLVLDDGAALQLADVEVVETTFAPERRCATGVGSGGLMPLAGLLLWRRARRAPRAPRATDL